VRARLARIPRACFCFVASERSSVSWCFARRSAGARPRAARAQNEGRTVQHPASEGRREGAPGPKTARCHYPAGRSVNGFPSNSRPQTSMPASVVGDRTQRAVARSPSAPSASRRQRRGRGLDAVLEGGSAPALTAGSNSRGVIAATARVWLPTPSRGRLNVHRLTLDIRSIHQLRYERDD
jgi:hypothetical protein